MSKLFALCMKTCRDNITFGTVLSLCIEGLLLLLEGCLTTSRAVNTIYN